MLLFLDLSFHLNTRIVKSFQQPSKLNISWSCSKRNFRY